MPMLFILILLLLFAGLIIGIMFWSSGPGSSSTGEMACGQCGYSVRGLTQLNCPECGADLREVGINRGQSSTKRGLGIALTLGCSAILLMGCLGSAFFMTNSPSSPTQSYPTPNTTTTAPPTSSTPIAPDASDPLDADNQTDAPPSVDNP